MNGQNGKRRRAAQAMRGLAAALAGAFLLAACAIEPEPLHLGSEECAQCRMVISDPQFAAQALNTRGKAFKFDAGECMAQWLLAGEQVPAGELHSLWVMDRGAPEESWVRVQEATFVRSDGIRSPMAAGLAAYASALEASRHRDEAGGEVLSWDEVLRVVQDQGGHAAHAHTHR